MRHLLKTLFFSCFIISTTCTGPIQKKYTIFLCPAGNIHDPGKKVGDHFSRGLTAQYAQAVASKIEQLDQNHRFKVTVIDKRLEFFETTHGTAHYINQQASDLVIYIDFYQELERRPSLSFFYLNDDSFIVHHKKMANNFVNIQKAHVNNQHTSINMVTKISSYFQKTEYQTTMQVNKPVGIPYLPLRGIVAPAFGIEIGLHHEEWPIYVEPLAQAIMSSCHEN